MTTHHLHQSVSTQLQAISFLTRDKASSYIVGRRLDQDIGLSLVSLCVLLFVFHLFRLALKLHFSRGFVAVSANQWDTIDKTIDESAIATASVGGDEEPRRLEIRGRVPSSDWRGKLKTWNFTSLTLGSSPTDFPSSPSLYLSTANWSYLATISSILIHDARHTFFRSNMWRV